MRRLRGFLIMVITSIFLVYETYYLIIDAILKSDMLNPNRYWATAIPVFMGVFVMSSMTIYIGYTMLVAQEPMKLTYEQAYDLAVDAQKEESG